MYLNIKTTLVVFSFLNAFLIFKKQESKKRNKEVKARSNPEDTNI